ncbi:MAG: P pilus assembly protein, chaperone PapD, partial [Cyanobacteria bacterium J06635_10]
MKINKLISYFTGCTLSTLLLLPGIAQAQVRVAPILIQTQTERGQAQGIIELTNNSNEPFRGRVYAKPFTYTKDGFKELESSSNDLIPYLIFSPRELEIQPQQTRRIRVLTRLLPSMKEGEYRAVIFTESLKPVKKSSGNSTVMIVTRIGTVVYVRHGDINPNFTIQNASYDAKNKRIILLVNNDGKASERPKVEWMLKQGETTIKSGKQDKTTVIAQGERNIILPYLSAEDKERKEIAPGEYQLTGKLIWGHYKNPKTQSFNVNLTIPTKPNPCINYHRHPQGLG